MTGEEHRDKWLSWDDIEWIGPQFDEREVYDAFEWYYVSEKLDERAFIGILNRFLAWTVAPNYYNMMPYIHINVSTPEIREPTRQECFINNLFCYVGRNNDLILRFYKSLRPLVWKVYSQTGYFERLNVNRYLQTLDETRNIFFDDISKAWNTELLCAMYEFLDTEAVGVEPEQIEEFFARYHLEIFDFSCRDDQNDEIPVVRKKSMTMTNMM